MKGVWVEPVPSFVTGELAIWASMASVSAIPIPGYWVHKDGAVIATAAPPMPGEKVIYALHGGAYISMSAHPSDFGSSVPRELLKRCDTIQRTFSIEYRLSSAAPFKPANPFPAALIDALAGYNYLVNIVGFSPSDIIVEGDSAGGNLALALVRYLVEHKVAIPSDLILISPWCDIGDSHQDGVHSSRHSDYINPSGRFDYAHDAFLGPHGMGGAAFNRYISPASLNLAMRVDFHGFPRTFIVAGEAEALIDQIHTLKARMIRDLGEEKGRPGDDGKVTYYEAPDGVHAYPLFSWHEPEREETYRAIVEWLSVS